MVVGEGHEFQIEHLLKALMNAGWAVSLSDPHTSRPLPKIAPRYLRVLEAHQFFLTRVTRLINPSQ